MFLPPLQHQTQSMTPLMPVHVYDEQSRLVFEQPATPPEQIVCHLPNEQVQRYVLNEVKLKLDHGHSISVTEDHLRNTSALIGGCQIPIKWCEVLKLMK